MKRWLLLPLLLPLAAALAIGVLNLRVSARLRLLVWTSPPLPLGSWVLLAAGGGAVAAAAAGLTASRPGRREPEPWEEPRRRRTRTRAEPAHEEYEEPQEPFEAAEPPPQPAPERSPHEAPPTVAVPFRVVQRAPSQPAASASTADDWNESADDEW